LSLRQSAVYANPFDLWTQAAYYAPNNPRVHTSLGGIYLNRGRIDDAQREFELAVSLSPRWYSATADMLLADVYGQKGRLKEAVALARESVTISPNQRTLTELGFLEYRNGDRAAAAAHLQNALDLDPRNADALVTLGQLRLEEGKADQAEELWTIAKQFPAFRDHALNELGRLYLSQRRDKRAERAFREALATSPFDLAALEGLAELLAMRGRRAAGLALFDDLEARIKGSRERLPPGDAGVEAKSMLDQISSDVLKSRAKFLARKFR
jgi:tetratricopeptide (TPR) repeat protein